MATVFTMKTWGFNSQIPHYTTSTGKLYKCISKQYKQIDTKRQNFENQIMHIPAQNVLHVTYQVLCMEYPVF